MRRPAGRRTSRLKLGLAIGAAALAVALAAAEQPLAVEKIRYDGKTAYFDGGSAADIPWPALQDSLQRSGWRVSREGNELGLSPNPP